MTDQKINNVLSGVVDMLKEMGYKVVYVALYGSQNYNLETPKSDLDFKAMVVPTLDDIVFGRRLCRDVGNRSRAGAAQGRRNLFV